MMNILPPEILVHIFKNLDRPDLVNAYYTCDRWAAIIDEYKVWKKPLEDIVRILKQNLKSSWENLYFLHIDLTGLLQPIEIMNRLDSIYMTQGEVKECFTRKHEYISNRYKYICKVDSIFMKLSLMYNFIERSRERKQLIYDSEDKNILVNALQTFHHVHSEVFYFLYSTDIGKLIDRNLVKYLFENYHVNVLILIPLVFTLIKNTTNCIVVYTNNKETEIAVILDTRINKCIKLPITLSTIKENLVSRTNIDFGKTIADGILNLLHGISIENIKMLLTFIYITDMFGDSRVKQLTTKYLLHAFPDYEVNVIQGMEAQIYDNEYCNQLPPDLPQPFEKFTPDRPYSITIEDFVFFGI